MTDNEKPDFAELFTRENFGDIKISSSPLKGRLLDIWSQIKRARQMSKEKVLSREEIDELKEKSLHRIIHPKGNRKAYFGSLEIVENPIDVIDPDEMKQYEDGFLLFKQVISSTNDPFEKAFLSSPVVFKLLTGIMPENSFMITEAHTLFTALKKLGSLDQFLLLGDTFPSFIHRKAAENTLRRYAQNLQINLKTTPYTADELTKVIQDLQNPPDMSKHLYITGILSGFPESAVKFYSNSHLQNLVGRYSLQPLMKETYNRLNKPLNQNDKKNLSRNFQSYLDLYLEFNDKQGRGTMPGNLIRGFGVSFRIPDNPGDDVKKWCQKMLEIDRRLGVLEYINEVRRQL